MKGIVFAGCSFTWGQGLYFYSNMDTLDYHNPNAFEECKVTDAHIRYKNTFRFPRLVANHFDSFEITNHSNGGSDYSSLIFIDNIFSEGFVEVYEPSEIDYVIFQTTQITRNSLTINYQGKNIDILMDAKNEIMYKWMIENGLDFAGLMDIWKKQVIKKIRNRFLELESKGIKCRILSWTDDYLNLIKSDEFLFERFINFDYDGVTYDCIDYMIKTNEGFTILEDEKTLGKVVYDDHPSKLCHRVIADNIIKNLEKDIK